MSKPKIKTQYNAAEFDRFPETITGPSVTIPDQTLSLKQLLDRFARGLPIDSEKFPIYHGEEEDLPDLAKMDISEIADLRDAVNKDIKDKQEELIRQQTELDKAEAEKNQKEQFKKWKEEEEKEDKPLQSKITKKWPDETKP